METKMLTVEEANSSIDDGKNGGTFWASSGMVMDTPLTLQKTKELWIEKVFKKRECVKFVHAGDNKSCGCGRLKMEHRNILHSDLLATAVSPATGNGAVAAARLMKWQPSKNTRIFPTDAFGQIEFQGDAHPNKAQYVRLEYATPPEHMLQLLLNHWKLELPKLLISVHGGIANFDLQPKLKRVFRKGLIRAANTTGAWIITGGTSTGVMKHVGEALAERTAKSTRKKNIVAIGIAPWGVVCEREDLIVKDACVEYHAVANPKSNTAVLNSSHNYFLLADNGSQGKYGAEIVLRKRLEHYISQQKISSRGEKPLKGVPVVCMVLEGGSNTIRTVLDYVTDSPAVPVVICDGSGRAADLLAFAHKYCNEEGLLPEVLKEQMVSTIQKTFTYSAEQAVSLYDELVLCMKKKELITVFRMGEQVQDIDLAILTALLKSHNMSAPQQLGLALSWDRPDLARSHIFTYGQEWPDGSLEQAMMDALIHDRVEFVRLLLDKGVNMTRFLTVGRLEELYNTRVGSTTTLYMVLRDVRKNKPLGARVTLIEVGLIMNRLMGGAYRSSYTRRKFKSVYHELMRVAFSPITLMPQYDGNPASHTFDYPFNELMVWAILLKRQEMATFMWQREEEVLAKAIVASKLYKALSKEALEDVLVDNVIAVELMNHSREFQKRALDFLDYVYKQDDDLAQQLLTYELKNWSGQTCLSLAYGCGMRAFIAHTCCQNLITDMWMGGLRMNKNHNVKVALGILLPMFIPMLGYKSQGELQLMPQTVEEHIQDLEKTSEAVREAAGEHGGRSGSVASSSHGALSSLDVEEEQIPDDYETPDVVTWQPITVVTPTAALAYGQQQQTSVGGGIGQVHGSLASGALAASIKKKVNRELRLSTKIYEFYSAPVTKFWLHTIAYFFFLGTISYTALVKLDRHSSHWTEVYTMAYMFFYTAEMVREIAIGESPKLSQKLSVFFHDKWNIIDAVAIPVFWLGAILRFQSDDLIFLWGKILYSLDTICWFVRILELFQVSRNLGPFVVIIEKLVKNIVNLLAFFCVVIWAFGVPRTSILNPYAEPDWVLAKEVMMEPYFMFYGELFADKINPPCGDGTGLVCWPGAWIVPILMTIYLLSSYVLLINLLIAVFNYTFMMLNANSMEIWMYQRYGLMIEYEVKPLLPPPFVGLSHLYLILKWLRRRLRKKPKIKDFGLKLFLSDSDIRKLHDFEEDCIGDYFLGMEMKHESSTDERIRVTNERVENITMKIDDINQKQSQLKLALTSLELRNSSLEALAMQTNMLLERIHDALSPQLHGYERLAAGVQSPTVASDSDSYYEHGATSASYRHQDQVPRSSRSLLVRASLRHTSALGSASPGARLLAAGGCEVPTSSRSRADSVLFTIGDEAMEEASSGGKVGSSAAATMHEAAHRPLEVGTGMLERPTPLALDLSALAPAVILQRSEYTSITDAIDTSCLLNASPQHSPTASRRFLYQHSMSIEDHGGSRIPEAGIAQGTGEAAAVSPAEENLHQAEENATRVIGGSLRMRIRGLSVNESATSLIGSTMAAVASAACIPEGSNSRSDSTA